MYIFTSLFLLFLIVGLLVCGCHLFMWNERGSASAVLRVWVSSFECGFFSGNSSECYFSYTYFILLVFFVIFDLEVSLLLNIPYGFCYVKNSLFYLFFLLVLGFGYSVELFGGYVRWSY